MELISREKNYRAINRLTALWALSESGLGGIMHALKIPLTGLFVGGFAVVIISLIAHYSLRDFRLIIQSTILVLLVKASVSPQSPFPAYIAVAFQGLSGGLIFSFVPGHKTAACLFGFLALIESALQKFLFLTILFGKSLWEALDSLFKGLLQDFHLSPDFSFSLWLITLYTIIHALWGIFLGGWSAQLPRHLETKSAAIIERFKIMHNINTGAVITKKGSKSKWFSVIFILGFIILIFIVEGKITQVLYVVMRTIGILLILFFIMKPLLSWILAHYRKKNSHLITEIMVQLPELTDLVKPAFGLARESHKGMKMYFEFIVILIILALMDKKPVTANTVSEIEPPLNY